MSRLFRVLSNKKLNIFTKILSLNLDNILSFDEDFKSDRYFSLRKTFKTFNGG